MTWIRLNITKKKIYKKVCKKTSHLSDNKGALLKVRLLLLALLMSFLKIR